MDSRPRPIHAGQQPDPQHRRGDDTDLCRQHLQAGRCRRAARRLRVLPHRQPDPACARGLLRCARGGRSWRRLLVRHGRRGRVDPRGLLARRPRRHPRRRVRRHLPPVQAGLRALGPRLTPPPRCTTPPAIAAAVQPGTTKIVWIETPSNPLLGVADIPALAQIAHDAGAICSCRQHLRDAVPAAPAHPRGRRRRALDDQVRRRSQRRGRRCDRHRGRATSGNRIAVFQNSTGATAGPFDAYLVLRGLKTLAVRMDRHCDNAERIVDFLRAPRRGRRDLLPGPHRPPRPPGRGRAR